MKMLNKKTKIFTSFLLTTAFIFSIGASSYASPVKSDVDAKVVDIKNQVELVQQLEKIDAADLQVIDVRSNNSSEIKVNNLKNVDLQAKNIELEDVLEVAQKANTELLKTEKAQPEKEHITTVIEALGEDYSLEYTATSDDSEKDELVILPSAVVKNNEEPVKEIKKESLAAIDTDVNNQSAVENSNGIIPFALAGKCNGPCSCTGEIPGGLGAKLPINKTGGTKLSYTVKTSDTSSTMAPSSAYGIDDIGGNCYLYGGFDAKMNGANCNSDMGFIYQKVAKTGRWAWKPFYRFSGKDTSIISQNNNIVYDGQVKENNGFIPGENIGVEIRIENNNKKVVLRTEGKAYHSTKDGSGINTWLVQLDYNKYPLSSITNTGSFKLIAHPAHTNDLYSSNYGDNAIKKARCYGRYTNIRVDGTIPNFGTVIRDFGYAEKNGSDSYLLQFCKGF